jgi:DNA-binding protein WhiA
VEDGVNEILNDLHLADSFFGLDTGISPRVLENDSWSQAYLRGAFLASGSVKDPEKANTNWKLPLSIVIMPMTWPI